MALVGTALAAGLAILAVLVLYDFFPVGSGVPADVASSVLLVAVAVAVACSIFAVPLALFAVRDREDVVDEAFLVHESGLLLVHLSKSLKAAKDQDVVAGMLTAVQSFIRESFAKGPSRELRQMDFGHRKILLRKGFWCYLAVVVRGRRPAAFTLRIGRALSKVERTYWRMLASWDGTTEGLEGADDLLRRELMDSSVRTLARDTIDAAVDGVTSGLVTRWQRQGVRGAAKRDDAVPSPRLRARDLLDRPEARDLQASYHELLVTALEQIREGRFTMAGATNVYLALALQKAPPPSATAWWDEVLVTVQDVLRMWPWDSVSQTWTEPRKPSPATAPEARPDETPPAPVAVEVAVRPRAHERGPLK